MRQICSRCHPYGRASSLSATPCPRDSFPKCKPSCGEAICSLALMRMFISTLQEAMVSLCNTQHQGHDIEQSNTSVLCGFLYISMWSQILQQQQEQQQWWCHLGRSECLLICERSCSGLGRWFWSNLSCQHCNFRWWHFECDNSVCNKSGDSWF